MATFNELLRVHGIASSDVALLRHSGRGPNGITPFDLLMARDGSFEVYQSTQAPGKKLFQMSKYWASFVVDRGGETLFVGLYTAKKGDRAEITWKCPMTGLRPGADKGRASDFYHLDPVEAFARHSERLRINWGAGGERAWAQHAKHSDKLVIGEIADPKLDDLIASEEGAKIWRLQRSAERDARLVQFALNLNASTNGGLYMCLACGFQNTDSGMFDVHHPHPLYCGERKTRGSELQVLCPTCHRRAHRSGNRMLPYSLEVLKQWNAAGCP